MSSQLAKRDPLDMAIGGGIIWKRGLREISKISQEQDQNIAMFANRAIDCCNWLAGDLLIRWERVYGENEMYQMAAEYLPSFKESRLAQCRWVAAQYPQTAIIRMIEEYPRHVGLDWSYYWIAGGLPTLEERIEILEQAVEESWSCSDLRDVVRAKKLAKTADANPLPKDKYRVIYADPPWSYNDERMGTTAGGGAGWVGPTLPRSGDGAEVRMGM